MFLHVIVPTLLNRKLEKYFASVRIWHYKSVEISLCVTDFSSSACPDEVIILSLPCHQSAMRTWVVFHLLLHVLKRILEMVAVVLHCLVNKSVVKWFVQRCIGIEITCKVKSSISQGNSAAVKHVGYKTALQVNSCLLHRLSGQDFVKQLI